MFSSSAISNSYGMKDGQIGYNPNDAPRSGSPGGSTMYNGGMPMYTPKSSGRDEPSSVYFSKPGTIEVVLPPVDKKKPEKEDLPAEDEEEEEEEEGEEEDELEDE